MIREGSRAWMSAPTKMPESTVYIAPNDSRNSPWTTDSLAQKPKWRIQLLVISLESHLCSSTVLWDWSSSIGIDPEGIGSTSVSKGLQATLTSPSMVTWMTSPWPCRKWPDQDLTIWITGSCLVSSRSFIGWCRSMVNELTPEFHFFFQKYHTLRFKITTDMFFCLREQGKFLWVGLRRGQGL